MAEKKDEIDIRSKWLWYPERKEEAEKILEMLKKAEEERKKQDEEERNPTPRP